MQMTRCSTDLACKQTNTSSLYENRKQSKRATKIHFESFKVRRAALVFVQINSSESHKFLPTHLQHQMRDSNELKQMPAIVEAASNKVKYKLKTKIWLQTVARPDLNPQNCAGKTDIEDQNARWKLQEGPDSRNMLLNHI